MSLALLLAGTAAFSWPSSTSSLRRTSGSKSPAAVQLSVVTDKALGKGKNHTSSKGKDDASRKCSYRGENCVETSCCSDAGMQCYGKDDAWGECKASCTEGPDPSSSDGGAWKCKELGTRAEGEATPCAEQGADCSASGCCQEPGLQCFEKAPGWAACKVECWPGMDLSDADDHPWSCKVLGPKTPGAGDWVAAQCAAAGTGCLDKSCCSTSGQVCYEKNAYYGECMEECPDGWGCKTRGSRTPQPATEAWQMPQGVAPWVADTCTKIGEDCRKTACCADPGNQCFEQNESHAGCKSACSPGPDLYADDPAHWSCKILGPKTPGWSSEPWKERKEVSAWVDDVCAEDASEDCRERRCCKNVGSRCFEKNKDWASCSQGCAPGKHPGDTGGNWSCKELGPRTHKPWGNPSIFCFSVVQPNPSYEVGLMGSQLGSGFGIFACDEFEVFSTEGFYLGDGPNGPVNTVTFVPAPVVESKDGTAGNSELFMHVWDAVKSVGKYQSTDWTIKVDPDAVLLPERLRWHLKPHTGENTYVINCAKPFMPEGPMMFGALEAFSRQALDSYFSQVGTCTGNMPWKAYGEDLFMGKCLEMIGVSRTNDFNIYSDGVCRGVDCTDPDAAAFHPKKDPDSWNACLEETKNPVPKETTDAPQWFKDYMDSYER